MLENYSFPICLAPMVGLTHVAMRESLRHYMPLNAEALWPTEMLSSFRLAKPQSRLSSVPMTARALGEQGLVPQILGNEEAPIKESIQLLKTWEAVGVDINMGCPVKKALKHNYGVSLMGDPDYASEVTSFAVKASELPVSVKFRAGLQKDLGVLKAFAKGIESAGASWVTLHPRTSAQKRRGRADWSQIRFLKETLKIPVFGNGDVQNLSDYYKMKEETGCDRVMVGRALTLRPWLLWQISEDMGLELPTHLKSKEAPRTPYEEGKEFGAHLMRFIQQLYFYFDAEEAMKKFRFYIRVAHPWIHFGHHFLKKTAVCTNQKDLEALVLDFFSRPQAISQSSLGAY